MTAIALPVRPRIRPKLLLVASVAVVIAGQAASAIIGTQSPPRPQSQVAPVAATVESADGPTTTAASLDQIDHSIQAWSANLAAEPKDYYSASNLGILYDARARLTGDVADYARATDALNRALAVAPTDLGSRIQHARELNATHDFSGALAEAKAILADAPHQPLAVATLGDAALELGDYDAATAAYNEIATSSPGAAVTARLARLALLRGDTASATSLAARAIAESAANGEVGPSASWYSYFAGTVALATGKPTDALNDFNAAVALWPDSYLALAGRGRAQAALGDRTSAIVSYEAAVAISPQPDAFAVLGDLYTLDGNPASAKKEYDTVEFIGSLAAINAQVYNRALALFWANHDRNTAQAVTMAQTELQTRKDIYGWDAYAWALLADGRAADANAQMQNALALGTHDALLSYHAGMIAAALGDDTRAKSLLSEALNISGALDPLAASKASQALAGLP
jgi:tetratricopeptide (TPR) repeat protein